MQRQKSSFIFPFHSLPLPSNSCINSHLSRTSNRISFLTPLLAHPPTHTHSSFSSKALKVFSSSSPPLILNHLSLTPLQSQLSTISIHPAGLNSPSLKKKHTIRIQKCTSHEKEKNKREREREQEKNSNETKRNPTKRKTRRSRIEGKGKGTRNQDTRTSERKREKRRDKIKEKEKGNQKRQRKTQDTNTKKNKGILKNNQKHHREPSLTPTTTRAPPPMDV